MSNFTNVTTSTSFVMAANNASSGYLAYTMVAVVWGSLFFATLPFGRSKAAAIASFINAIVIVLLDNMGMFSLTAGTSGWWIAVVDVLIFGISVGIMMFSKRRN